VIYREVGLAKLCALVLSLIRHHGAENGKHMCRVSHRLPHFRGFLLEKSQDEGLGLAD
jgi:hypothetical protein